MSWIVCHFKMFKCWKCFPQVEDLFAVVNWLDKQLHWRSLFPIFQIVFSTLLTQTCELKALNYIFRRHTQIKSTHEEPFEQISYLCISCLDKSLQSSQQPDGKNKLREENVVLSFKTVNKIHWGKANLPQTVSFAERLVGHVLKLIRDRTGAPSGRVVLDHRGVELRHDLKSEGKETPLTVCNISTNIYKYSSHFTQKTNVTLRLTHLL